MNGKTVTRGTGNGRSKEAGNPVVKAANDVERSEKSMMKAREKFVRDLFDSAKEGKWAGVVSLVHPKCVNERDGHGRTLLMLAAAQGEKDAVEKLIEKGANVNLVDNHEMSALVHAMRQEHHDVAKWLKENGADWRADLEVLVRDRRKMMIFSMIDVLGISGDDVAEAEAEFDPERGPPVAYRVKRRSRYNGDETMGLHELEILPVPREKTPAAAPKPPGEGGENAEKNDGQHEILGEFVC